MIVGEYVSEVDKGIAMEAGRVIENSGQGKAKQYKLGRSDEKRWNI